MLPINVNLPLKSVTDRIESCRAVHWAIDVHGIRLVGKLGESFGPLLEEGQVMPFEIQLQLFAKKLSLTLDQVVTSDRAYRDQKAQEFIARAWRDTQVKEVNSGVVGLRQAFEGLYSEKKLAEIGFARRTPQVPVELLEQASHLVTHLSSPDLDLTGSRFDDFQLDVSIPAQKLVQSVENLQQAVDDLGREERETEAMRIAKDEALETHNTSFLWIARTVESLCRLAGLPEVAKRVRPSRRRPGVTEKVAKSETVSFAPLRGDHESTDEATGSESAGEASSESSPEVAAEAPRSS